MELNQRYVRRRNMSLTPQTNDQFQHTLKWNMMLQHFYENISLKRRRINANHTCMCFTGSNAVNVLFSFLRKNRGLFSSCESIKRNNVISLCTLYLETGNIEVVQSCTMSPKKRNKFKDSSSAFYRFTERAMSTLVQYKQRSGSLTRTSRGQIKSLDIEAITSLPISKHDSVESLFHRIQKNLSSKGVKKVIK